MVPTMRDMTPAEAYAFLAHGTRTGKLAVTRHDGRPHVSPIWFVVDGDDLVFTTWHASVKARALQREGRAALVVDDQEPPYSFVMVEGTVEIAAEPEDLIGFTTRIGGRYMGRERAEEFGRRNGVPGEIVVRLRPERLVAKAEVSA
jgi:PPOX class probable F420-dependent enzyme